MAVKVADCCCEDRAAPSGTFVVVLSEQKKIPARFRVPFMALAFIDNDKELTDTFLRAEKVASTLLSRLQSDPVAVDPSVWPLHNWDDVLWALKQQVLHGPCEEYRGSTDYRAKQFGPLEGNRGNQQATVAATIYRQMSRRGNFSGDQVFGHGNEIIKHLLAIGLQTGLMPARAKFAAAANIGHDVDAPIVEPGIADRGGITRNLRN